MEDEKVLDETEPKVIRSLAECKIASQHLHLQLEQREKDYTKLQRQKQEYFYENVAWLIMFGVVVLSINILEALSNGLFTSSMIAVIILIIEVGALLILVHVLYLSRHFFGMENPKTGKFARYQDIFAEYKMYLDNIRDLSEKADIELEQKIQEEEELNRDKKAAETAAFAEETRLLSRWDFKDEKPAAPVLETKDLSDTAKLIFEELKENEPTDS